MMRIGGAHCAPPILIIHRAKPTFVIEPCAQSFPYEMSGLGGQRGRYDLSLEEFTTCVQGDPEYDRHRS